MPQLPVCKFQMQSSWGVTHNHWKKPFLGFWVNPKTKCAIFQLWISFSFLQKSIDGYVYNSFIVFIAIFDSKTISEQKAPTGRFVCWDLRLRLNIWGHIVTVPVCSSGTLTVVLPHLKCNAADTPPSHTIQTQGQPVVLSIDVECHTGIHNNPI